MPALRAAAFDPELADDAPEPPAALPVWFSAYPGLIYRTNARGSHEHPRSTDLIVMLSDLDDDLAAMLDARPDRGARDYADWLAGMRSTLAVRLGIKQRLWAKWRAREAAALGVAA